MRKYGHPINKTLLAGKPAFTSRLIKRLHMWTFDFAVIRDNPNFRLGVQAPNVKIFDYNTKSTTDLYSFLDSLYANFSAAYHAVTKFVFFFV